MTTLTPKPSFALITLLLPGPDRKRKPSPYHYRITYRNPDPSEPGCVMTWDVLGGREPYQIALERTDAGNTVWHCTCADAVFHGENDHAHHCKHVSGLRDTLPRAA
ncbi:hypothetical protein [Urbifossiella limnaea]|uniref:SWIM-type domain-containing protein n=1 Tax=Urbifossiella limnaea TaxID=2528023 RepID=A0A517XTL9_9BACT|nr:hypothetical protein [Urbifossiella limnaea]QDU20869.1 hypothetical protein ETAA1_28320 [Urbifossiella limnaea]